MFPVLNSFIHGRRTETSISYGIIGNVRVISYGIIGNVIEISSLGLTVCKSINFKN
jgi:hypothetical protein